MMKPLLPVLGTLGLMLIAAPVQAKDKLRGETVCFPADKVIKILDELAEVKPKRRDIVDVGLQPRFMTATVCIRWRKWPRAQKTGKNSIRR